MEKINLEDCTWKENKKENIFACQIFLTCVRKVRCVKEYCLNRKGGAGNYKNRKFSWLKNKFGL